MLQCITGIQRQYCVTRERSEVKPTLVKELFLTVTARSLQTSVDCHWMAAMFCSFPSTLLFNLARD